MNTAFRSLLQCFGLLTAIALVSPSSVSAAYMIGQYNSDNYADNLRGQGFTPNQIGPNGSGLAPASGAVTLSSFTLAYDANGARTPDTTLYLYTSLPTSSQAASGTGALYTSTSFADLATDPNFGFPSRTFTFANVSLEASQKYFAVTPNEQSLRYIFGQNLYGGGAFILPNLSSLQETGGLADLAFRADLVAVPFEFSPLGGLMVGATLFGIDRYQRSKAQK